MTRKLIERLSRIFGRRHEVAQDNTPLAKYVDQKRLYAQERLVRLGTAYGGWWIPVGAGLTEKSICYLAGAGEDLSFDCALVRRFHCQARIVDPTPRAVQHFHDLSDAIAEGRHFPINNSATDFYEIPPDDFARIKFLPVGLSDKDVEMKFYLPKDPKHVSCSTMNLQGTDDYFTAQCHRLRTLMAEHGDTTVDLLKMDIEGAEYSVIKDLVECNLLPRVLLIEFDEVHSPQDADAPGRIKVHVELLENAGMRCVAIEGSNMTLIQE